jgi:PAS domain S-box-containing protein
MKGVSYQDMKSYLRIALVTSVTILLLVLATLFAFTVQQTWTLSNRLRTSLASMETTGRLCAEITSNLLRQYSLAKHYFEFGAPNDKQEFLELSFKIYRKYYALEKSSVETQELQQISGVKGEQFHFENLAMRVFVAAETGHQDEAADLMLQLDTQANFLGERLKVLNDIAGRRILEAGVSLDRALGDFSLAIGAILFSTIIGTILFLLLARRNVLKPTSELIRGTREVAAGNLDLVIDVKVRNELGMLAESFNEMVRRLNASREETRLKAEELERLNREITALNETLEQNVEERTAALRESEAFLQQLIYKSPVGIAIFDHKGICTDCNEAFLRLLGEEERNSVLGASFLGKSGKLTGRDMYIAFSGALRGEGRRTEPIHHEVYGKTRWYVHNFFPISGTSGEPDKVILFSDDVTEEKLARDRIHAKNIELEGFVYTVSHDLKSPLFSLIGLLRLLESKYQGSRDEDLSLLMGRIVGNLNKMEQMITDLLELSRVGIRKADFRELDFNQIVSGILLEEKVRSGGEGVEFDVARLPKMTADEAQITSLFQNLINNAFKYRDPDRTLKVGIGCEEHDGFILFTVEDNGIGIDDDLTGKIFDVFFSTAGGGIEGSGVGLAIAKKIVEVHGGRIWVESKKGRGSSFRFTIARNLGSIRESL